jgi:peptidoglycan hydrolase-like protein with peptidoglycan-binding domain
MAAGTFTVSAVAAQSTAAAAQPSTSTHKPTGSSNKSSAAKHSSATSTAHTRSSSHTADSAHSASPSASEKKSTRTASSRNSRRKTKKVKGQMAPTPERITEIQGALVRKGVFTGTPTGEWDDSTVDAMKKFQTANGLNPTGKVDALTLQKLGLGSETAGLAAPTPPPNATNRLKNISAEPSN